MPITLCALALAAVVADPVPDKWVAAVEAVETGGRNVDGDRGKAKGVLQWHARAWADCSRVRKAAGLPTWPYTSARDPERARAYASTWLTYLRARLTREIGRPALANETWLAWNLGFEGFRRYRFQAWHPDLPAARYDAAQRVQALTK
jgi:hypothetical protein